MAWNEPGKGSPDPWNKQPSRPPSGGGSKGDGGGGLEALWRRLKTVFSKLPRRSGGLQALLLAVVVAWLLVSSHTRIDEGQTGIVLRFGHYVRSLDPGFHLRLPRPFETVLKVNGSEVRAESGALTALTADRGLVELHFTMQYQISDPRQYLFAAAAPETMVRDAVETAVRISIGQRRLDQVLSAGGAELGTKLRAEVQQQIDQHPVGLQIMAIDIQDIEPPDAVHDAYAAISAARSEAQAAQDAARAYAAKLDGGAQIDAQRVLDAANSEQAASVARAQSEVAGFDALLDAYHRNPGLTRRGLWLSATEQVLAANAKVVDGSGQATIHVALGGHGATPAPAASSAAAAAESKDKQP